MSDDAPRQWYSESEKAIAERLTAEGYDVVREPVTEDLQSVLGEYRPDIIARKGDEVLVVEVKRDVSRTSVERFREINRRVRSRPGWRFLLVSPEKAVSDLPDELALGQLSEDAVRDKVRRARVAVASGAPDAGFLLLWAAFEALLRVRARESMLPAERMPSSTLLKHLYTDGVMTHEELEEALGIMDLRNRLIHGYQAEKVEEAFTALDGLMQRLGSREDEE